MKEFIFSKIAYTKNDAAAFKVFFFQIFFFQHFVMAVFEVEILAIQSCSRNRFLKHKTTTHHTFLKVSVVFLKKSNHEF